MVPDPGYDAAVQDTVPTVDPTATDPEIGQLSAAVDGVDWAGGQLGCEPW